MTLNLEEQKDYKDAYLAVILAWNTRTNDYPGRADDQAHEAAMLFVKRMQEIRK